MKYTITEALIELKPGAEWTLRGDTYADLEWLYGSQPKQTEDEVTVKIAELQTAEPFRLLRIERNKRLAECDWIVSKNVEYGQNISIPWRNYRQALRDLPNITYKPELDEFGYLKMDSVAWPTPPE